MEKDKSKKKEYIPLDEENKNLKIKNKSNSLTFQIFTIVLAILSMIICYLTKNLWGVILALVMLIVSFIYLNYFYEDESQGFITTLENKSYVKSFYYILYFFFALQLMIGILVLSKNRNLTTLPNNCSDPGCTMVSPWFSNRSGKQIYTNGVEYKVNGLQKLLNTWLINNTNNNRSIFERKEETFIHAEITIPFMGFIDDLAISIVPSQNQIAKPVDSKSIFDKYDKVNIYSYSELRVGISDLGVNDRRIASLYKSLEPNKVEN